MDLSAALHSVSVAAIIRNDAGEVLLIQRSDNGHWEPPGGVLEPAETVINGLQREIAEETGLVVQATRLTGVYKNMVRGVIALVFLADATGGKPLAQTAEARSIEWVPVGEVPARCHEAYAVRVLDALQSDAPAVRAHNGVNVTGE